MTHIDFNQILSSLAALSPDQVRQLRQQLDRQLTKPKTPIAKPPGKGAKRTKAAPQPAKKPMTKNEFHRHLIEIGLMSRLPDTAADFDDPDDEPVPIKGEPLSETVIRERR
jgi:hypothetical protein